MNSKPVTSSELYSLLMQRIKQQIEALNYKPSVQIYESSIKDKSYNYVATKLCQWFARDIAFEVGELSLSKGINLTGNVGSGKSLLMSTMHDLAFELKLPSRFRSVPTRTVANDYKVEGYESLRKYTEHSFGTAQGYRYKQIDVRQPIVWYFDDFGLELEFINGRYELPAHYANKSNVMAEVFLDRWNHFVRYGMFTHVSSNIRDGDIIEAMYGLQVRSRMRQMFNTIELISPDKRV